jgi:putative inorganic carbon (HCO3(-)) transporter
VSGRALFAPLLAVAALAACLAPLALLPPDLADRGATLYPLVVGAVGAVAIGYVVWRVEPCYSISAAVLLSAFAGNWPRIGIPGPASPDRLLLAGGILAVLLRAPGCADRPRLQITGTHVLLALASLYALASAFVAGTLFDKDAFLRIVDTFGLMPFLLFLTAPLAFRLPHQRRALLVAFVALGAYLGVTVVLETVKLDALIWPQYIIDPSIGIHVGRGRGPFLEAVTNGLALFTCAVVCAIAVHTWQGRGARFVAGAVGMLCLVGAFLSLQRSVWIGVIVATCVGMLATAEGRRRFVPVVLATSLVVVSLIVLVPGLHEEVTQRINQKETLWDRRNLARAAVNMVESRPLLGFGWARFQRDSPDYFEQAFDYPLTAVGFGVHNTELTYAVDLGLIGLTLWLLGMLFGIGGALATRGPPDLLPWRVGLLTVATATLIVISAVPPSSWPNRALWLLAGVAASGRYALARR